ncbi:unnamed protein product [Lactuca saligna]|uniref:Uncharacterized protein n=1 Tax=Lactuca saligna TaxID=75948 RepID=A0AA36A041_LACSI|nr:unnamed protein product [Lactuca saligna]
MNFTHLLRSFTNTSSAPKGRAVHAMLIKSGVFPDVYTYNHLITMYCKTNRINDARLVFDKMPQRNLISWTTLISSYSHMGFSDEALDCFRSMVADGFAPNHYTYVSALSACANLGVLITGKEIHAMIIKLENKLNSFVENSLVNFYGKCGKLKNAMSIFNEILDPNEVSWTSLVSCACQCGEYFEGLKIFSKSHKAAVKINEFACATVLGASAAVENMNLGIQLHSYTIKCGIRNDQFVITGLVNMYAKCGQLEMALQAFHEVNNPHLTTYTALIQGFVQQGKGKEATNLFLKLHSSNHKPNERTFATILGAFIDTNEIKIGTQLHSLITKLGYISFTFVGNSLIDFYSKNALLQESLKIFQEMTQHDVVTWNTLISGHMNLNCHEEALQLLRDMLFKGFELNLYSYSSILNICGNLPAVEWGKQTHGCIVKHKFDSNVVVGSALIDMYAKCGRLSNARVIFDKFNSKNIVLWNTMINGYAHHGHGKESLEIYDMMLNCGVKPNSVTFIGVLSACGHSGLLEEGLHHFRCMRNYDITPGTDHLACIVNLFSRKGKTKLALDFINSFDIKPDKVVWRCLLSGCRINKDFELGKYAAEKILSIDPDDVSAHVMLSNIYGELNMWHEIAKVRKVMKDKVLKKDTGYSWIELKNKTYLFSSGQDGNFEAECVSEVLNVLNEQLFDEGYVPGGML